MTSRAEIFQEMKAAGPQAGYGSWVLVSLLLAVIGGAAFWIGVSGSQAERAWQVFLVNYLFWSGLAFGSILISAALVITKARWGRPLKRLAEAPAAFLPLSFLLFWVLYLGRDKLFPWIHEPLSPKRGLVEYRVPLCPGWRCPLSADRRLSGPGLLLRSGGAGNLFPGD